MDEDRFIHPTGMSLGPNARARWAAREDRARIAEHAIERLSELVHELLDAHVDTTHLAEGLVSDPNGTHEWGAHMSYLRDLQRVGHELLAWQVGSP
jgi:hypothetical protein